MSAAGLALVLRDLIALFAVSAHGKKLLYLAVWRPRVGWEKKFTFDKEPSHGAGILGQIKGSDGKCFGVDDLVTPVMTSCDDSDETTGKTDYLVDNSWYLIEYD